MLSSSRSVASVEDEQAKDGLQNNGTERQHAYTSISTITLAVSLLTQQEQHYDSLSHITDDQ